MSVVKTIEPLRGRCSLIGLPTTVVRMEEAPMNKVVRPYIIIVRR